MMSKTNRTWIILLLLFLGPPLLAWYLYTQHPEWLNKTANKGILLSPPINLTKLSLMDTSQFQGKWLLMYIIPGDCDEICEQDRFLVQQVHKALGKEQSRVHRIVIKSSKLDTGLYIVDPWGNVIMHYPKNIIPRAVKDDMSRLLKASQIG